MKRLGLVALCCAAVAAVAGAGPLEVIEFSPSHRSTVTQGFEQDDLDFVLEPVNFANIKSSTFVLDLDGSGIGTALGSAGIRGAMALRPASEGGGFSPHVGLQYWNDLETAADQTQNVELSMTGYDLATGTYATITESVSAATGESDLSQTLKFIFGLPVAPTLGVALEGMWVQDRYVAGALDYTNTYTNAAAPTPSTLDTMGDRTEASVDLAQGTNEIGLEIEVGLASPGFSVSGSLGVGLLNLVGANSQASQTVTTYSGGMDPTAEDGSVTTVNAGSFYWNGAFDSPRFSMASDMVTYPSGYSLALDTLTTLRPADGATLEIPLAANWIIHPEQQATGTTTTVQLNEADGTETARSVGTTQTTLVSPFDLTVSTGARFRKSVNVADNAILYFGAGILPTLAWYCHQMERIQSTLTRLDGDADGLYTNAATDTDTLYVMSGYGRQYSTATYGAALELPLALSWSPLPALTFHAGTTTSFDFSVVTTSTLLEGATGYTTEQFTDNLVAANSYVARPIDGSSDQATPTSDVRTDMSFGVSSSFGFSLALAPKLKVGAIATLNGVSFQQFSLTCTFVR